MYKKSHFHFVGINGIGMSAIAKILYQQGHTISGCDLADSLDNVQELINQQCTISNTHNSEICQNSSIDTIVYSSDITSDNPELIQARQKGITTITRAALLAEIIKFYNTIGVAGSHGKTTTTGMIGHILIHAQIDPTIIVGGIMQNIQSNSRLGKGNIAVVETDESDKSLLLLPISLATITNIDFEHVNTYKNIDEVCDIFTKYINKLPFYGTAVLGIDNPNIQKILPKISCKILTYGTKPQANIQAKNIVLNPDYSTFDIYYFDKFLGNIKIYMPSIYNVLNATAAITTCLELGISFLTIQQALLSFTGIDRRFSCKGIIPHKNIEIFDDYGHHPTEIQHSLITAYRKCKNNLIVVFQPQRYSRTFHLWDEFINAFISSKITYLIITDIYGASEMPIKNITGEKLAQAIEHAAPHIKVFYIPYSSNLCDIQNKIESIISNNDLIMLLGAGKINKLAHKLLP